MEMTIDIILLGLVLTVVGLFLKRWEPPIKEQYVVMILTVVGSLLGYLMLGGFYGVLWGICYSGLVFYKDILVEEAKEVKNSFIELKKTSKQENENIKDNEEAI